MTLPRKSAPENSRFDLLDELTILAGCEFLSDLRQPQWRQAVCRALEKIAPDRFSLRAWRDCAAYFLGDVPQLESPRAVRDAILAKLFSAQ